MPDWKQGTFGCFGDCEVCLCGYCCGCLIVKRNADDMGRGDGLLCCLLSLCIPCLPVFVMRSEARERYGIDGSTVDDAVCSFCCSSSVNCQTAVEIKERGDRS